MGLIFNKTTNLITGAISMISLWCIFGKEAFFNTDNMLIFNFNFVICSLFILIAAILSFITKNSDSEAITIFYWFASVFCIDIYEFNKNTYMYLLFFRNITFYFGLINLGSILLKHDMFKNKQKRYLLYTSITVIGIIFFIYASGIFK